MDLFICHKCGERKNTVGHRCFKVIQNRHGGFVITNRNKVPMFVWMTGFKVFNKRILTFILRPCQFVCKNTLKKFKH